MTSCPFSKPIIVFDDVTKRFSKNNHKTFKEFLPALIRGEPTTNQFTALSNISFTINRGETIGIIGPNGSGKSTILKLIAGVMAPSSGTLKVEGKISPLIELGAGFHPELTGRENIYLNGAILGLSHRQIESRLPAIVEFSELQNFIDEPVKRYSSGMYMRLGFSVAVHVDPQILLIDEILAVGDPKFQQKCFKKMNEFKKTQVTIIYVSHQLSTVIDFCSRAILIDHSRLLQDGNPALVCRHYHPQSSTL